MKRTRTGFVCLLALAVVQSAQAVDVTLLDWNILTYNDPASSEYAALVRVVQAVNPDIICFEEATNSSGRSAFLNAFSSKYHYYFLGAPTYDNPRQQIISSYPLTATGQLFVADPDGGTFERPTIWANVNVVTATPEPELRLYAAHFKAGSATRDWTLKNEQATADADSISTLLTSNPAMRVIFIGDLNCAASNTPVTTLLSPSTTLSRLDMRDPNNHSAVTYVSSGNTLDHAFRSANMSSLINSYYIFNTATFASGHVPSPALSTDCATASDHLALVIKFSIPDVQPIEARINEAFIHQQNGPETQEFIELTGPAGGNLTGLSVVVINGDTNYQGRVSAVWSLTNQTIPASGFFVLGDATVNPDLNIGTNDTFENGTQTILLVEGAAVSVGDDIDVNNDGTPELNVATRIVDSVALVDEGIYANDKLYYAAPMVGPMSGDVPGGAARCPDGADTDTAADWHMLGAAMDGSDSYALPTPKASNISPIYSGFGDFNHDCRIDAQDIAHFLGCMNGPTVAPSSECLNCDLDGDGDADQQDFAILQLHLTGM